MTDSFGPGLARAARWASGSLAGSCCPHYDSEPQRDDRPTGSSSDQAFQPATPSTTLTALVFPGTDLAGGRGLDPRRPGRTASSAVPTGVERDRAADALPGSPERQPSVRSQIPTSATAVGAFAIATRSRRRDSTVARPPGRHRDPARTSGERSEDEESLARRDGAARPATAHRLRAGSSLRPCDRPLDVDPVAAEDQQVEVELARPPSSAVLGGRRRARDPATPQERERARSGVGPAGTSRATTAFRKSGWSTTPTGRVGEEAETHHERGPRAEPPSERTAAASVRRASPTLAPSPTYARTRRPSGTRGPPVDSAPRWARRRSSSCTRRRRATDR